VIVKLVLRLDDAELADWVEVAYVDVPEKPDIREAVRAYLDEKTRDELLYALWPWFEPGDPVCVTAMRIEIDGGLVEGGWEEDEA
jgi:type IV secretory pathway protease TraF